MNNDRVKAIVLLAICERATIDGVEFDFTMVEEAKQPKEKPHPNALTFDELEDGKNYLLCTKQCYNTQEERIATVGFYYPAANDFGYFASERLGSGQMIHGTSPSFIDEYFTKYVHKPEPSQPDYSHLIGKWLKCINAGTNNDFTFGKWYQVCNIYAETFGVKDNRGKHNGWIKNSEQHFDLSNPSDTNPDEVKKILVPSEIEISKDHEGMNLHFGQNQMLCVSPRNESWSVFQANRIPIQCELVKCERKDLVKGDIAFRASINHPNFNNLTNYCVIIDDSRYCVIVSNSDVVINGFNWNHWYKVTPINE